MVSLCPRRNSFMIRVNVLRVTLDWQHSEGLQGILIGIQPFSITSRTTWMVLPCKTTGIGQGQLANVLKNLSTRALKQKSGLVWQMKADNIAKCIPPRNPNSCGKKRVVKILVMRILLSQKMWLDGNKTLWQECKYWICMRYVALNSRKMEGNYWNALLCIKWKGKIVKQLKKFGWAIRLMA